MNAEHSCFVGLTHNVCVVSCLLHAVRPSVPRINPRVFFLVPLAFEKCCEECHRQSPFPRSGSATFGTRIQRKMPSITDDRGPRINAIVYALFTLTTLAAFLRCWAKRVAHNVGFWWDDWLSLLALVSQFFLCTMMMNSSLQTHIALNMDTLCFDHLLGLYWPWETH